MNTPPLVRPPATGVADSQAGVAVGQRFTSAPYVVNTRDDQAFAEVTGDYNPLHWDATFAARTRFGRPLVHGLTLVGRLVGFMVSALATIAADRYAIYESQTLRFLAPVYFGDRVEFELDVLDWQPDKHRLVLASRIYKLDPVGGPRTLATEGEARVRLFPLSTAGKEAG